MQIFPITPIRLSFKDLAETKNYTKDNSKEDIKDDTKIYKKGQLKTELPNYNYMTPIKIWERKAVPLQEGQLIDKERNTVFNRHTTAFFRPDLDWNDFGNYLKEKFSDTDKVNTYVWGCSYGEEAYSLSMLLHENFKDFEKFYPIQAIDIDPLVIKQAKKEKDKGVELTLWGVGAMKDALNIKDKETENYVTRISEDETYKLNDFVTSPVEFRAGNIVVDIEKTDSKNPSIIFCRNMWPYISPDKYDECAKKMYNNLKEGSVVVIGNFDFKGDDFYSKSNSFPIALNKAGFKNIKRVNSNRDYFMNDFLIFEK